MFRNGDIAGCEIQTGDMGTPPKRASILYTGLDSTATHVDVAVIYLPAYSLS